MRRFSTIWLPRPGKRDIVARSFRCLRFIDKSIMVWLWLVTKYWVGQIVNSEVGRNYYK
jgi:hypothetical protein